jgi:hypothetical protein
MKLLSTLYETKDNRHFLVSNIKIPKLVKNGKGVKSYWQANEMLFAKGALIPMAESKHYRANKKSELFKLIN